MRLIRHLLAATSAIAVASSAKAQTLTVDSLRTGDVLRIAAVPLGISTAVSTLRRRGPDTLHVATLPGYETYAGPIPLTALNRLDVGRRGRSAPRTILGVIGGAFIGGYVGANLGSVIECGGRCEGEWAGITGTIFGGGAGLLAGSIAGGVLIGRTTVWHPVTIRSR